MLKTPLQSAGSALIWQALNLIGIKSIFFIRLIILARLLSPDDFGLIAIAVTAIGLLMSVTDFGMIPALVQGKDVDDHRYHVAWTIRVSRALLVTTAVFFSAPIIAALFSEPRATDIIRVLAFHPLIEALASIRLAGLTRGLFFRPLTLLGLSQAIVNTIISIALASSYGVWGLVAGTLAGSLWYSAFSYILAPHLPRLLFKKQAVSKLASFGRWIFFTSLIAVAGSYVLRVTISRQLGTVELGLYYLGAQIAFLPAEVASEVIGAVAFPLFARLQTKLVQAARVFRMIFTGMASLLIPVCALIIVLAPTLVNDVLGPGWEGTVSVIRILTLVSAIGIFGEATTPLFKGLGQPQKVTIVEATQSVIIIAFVWMLTERFGLIGAAISWLPAIVSSQIISAIFMEQLFVQPFKGLRAPLITVFIVASSGGFVAFIIDQLVPGLVGFVLATIVGVTATALLFWISDRLFGLGFASDLSLVFPQIAPLLRREVAEPESFST